MKKYIIIMLSFLSFIEINAQQCGQPNPDFCPGNYFTNGNFEQITGNPTASLSNDINLATGWSALWNGGGGTADLTCQTQSHGLGVDPLPDSGFYGGMWIINSPNRDSENNTYREGMYNELGTTIAQNSGTYTFNFDMANGGPTSNSNTPVAIDIYGVYNPTNSIGSAPLTCYNASNYNLWASNPSVKVFKLGTITTPVGMDNNWEAQTVTFNSNIITTPNITHIMISRSENIAVKWNKMYINFDNFCLQRTGGTTEPTDELIGEVILDFDDLVIPTIPQKNDCCPPWNEEIIKKNMKIITDPNGGLNANYTVMFSPTQELKNQMQAYINYAHAMNSSINSIIVHWTLSKKSTQSCEGSGQIIETEKFTTWTTGNNGAINGGNFWSGFPMEVGTWYKIHTGIYLNDGQEFFDKDCANNDICVRIQVQNGMKTLELNINGKSYKKTSGTRASVKKPILNKTEIKRPNKRSIKRN